LRSLLLAFVGWSAIKTLWGTCMVEDVVAWLPTPPCLHLTYFLHMVVALESLHVVVY
jgi:hypothetical protein